MAGLTWDADGIAERRRRGDGEGERGAYRPWLTVRSMASRGTAYRVLGKFGRTHHFLSAREYKCYLMLAWSNVVTDIREQFPLHELMETASIAEDMRVKHPTYRRKEADGSGECAAVMTTDFLVSLADLRGLPHMMALSVKPSTEFAASRRRVTRLVEKAEIERRYWAARNVPFRFVTDEEMPDAYVQNIKLLLGAQSLDGLAITAEEVPEALAYLADQVRAAPTVSLASICSAADKRLRFTAGLSLALVWHALGTRQWSVDLMQRLRPDMPIPASLRCARAAEPTHNRLHA